MMSAEFRFPFGFFKVLIEQRQPEIPQ